MRLRTVGLVFAAVVALAVVGAGAVYLSFPTARQVTAVRAPITAEEHAATIAALKPPKRARPLIAVIGANSGSETTDYLVPYGVLKRSGVADVVALGTTSGPMMLMPALAITPEATTADFSQRHPEGADYVIVPALHDSTDPAIRAFIRAQAALGATIVGICDGTLVLAHAGLLDGRRATGHWFSIGDVRDAHPTMQHVRDRRFVVDRGVATTTGISASVPMSLTLVEAIGGRERAETLARELGVARWDAAHDSGSFHLTRGDLYTTVRNKLASLAGRDVVGIRVADGADVVALAFTADAYSRTYRSQAVAVGGAITTSDGLRLLADGSARSDVMLDLPRGQPARAIDTVLVDIAARYGQDTSDMVRLQLEDAGHTTRQASQ